MDGDKSVSFFKEQLKELLVKSIGGIHIRQVRYELEKYTGKKFPEEEYLKFLMFLYECRQFVEVRSKETGGVKDLFVYIKLCEVTAANARLRSSVENNERDVARCETVLEDSSQIFFSLPRFFRPKPFIPGRERQPPAPPHDFNKCNICRDASGSEVGRVKRTSILDSHTLSSQSFAQQFQMQNLSSTTTEPHQQSKSHVASQPKNVGTKDVNHCNNGTTMDNTNLPKVTFPKGEFFIKLLGCDANSYLYIRIEERNDIWKRHKIMKQRLSKLNAENLQPVSLDSLQEGANLLAFYAHSERFFRALVTQKNSDDGSVELYDVDTADRLQRVVKSMYVLPAEFSTLPPRAIKVALDNHTQYLETDSLFKVMDHPTVQHYYNCEYVDLLHANHLSVPVVKLTDVNEGSLVSFHPLIAQICE